jgi:hypothetical protein
MRKPKKRKLKTRSHKSKGAVYPGQGESAARRAYRVNEFCDAFRISRPKAYELMKSGALRYFHASAERRISVEAADAFSKGS